MSIPRRDSKSGPGHRGIAVVGDAWLSPEEASRRRDCTINALLFDPLAGRVLDPHGGLRDLERRVLRHVESGTFKDDPLRALRAVQLAARFDWPWIRKRRGSAPRCLSPPARRARVR